MDVGRGDGRNPGESPRPSWKDEAYVPVLNKNNAFRQISVFTHSVETGNTIVCDLNLLYVITLYVIHFFKIS